LNEDDPTCRMGKSEGLHVVRSGETENEWKSRSLLEVFHKVMKHEELLEEATAFHDLDGIQL
jgi:hypothetical protein